MTSTSVSIIEAPTPWSNPYGDLLVETSFVSKLTSEEFKDVKFLNLHYVAQNPIIALEVIPELQESWKVVSRKFMYKDAILKREAHGFVPVGILSTDIFKYIDHYAHPPYWIDMALDQSWVFTKDIQDAILKCNLPRSTNLLLGSGYTDFFSTNDGSWSFEPQYLTLDNQDKIIGVGLVWHNK